MKFSFANSGANGLKPLALTGCFAIVCIQVRHLWHFQHRIIRKTLAHTVCVFLNLQLHRKPLDFQGLPSQLFKCHTLGKLGC